MKVLLLFSLVCLARFPALAQDSVKPPTPSAHLTEGFPPAVPVKGALYALKNGTVKAFASPGSVIALKPSPLPNVSLTKLLITVDRQIVQQYDLTSDADLSTYFVPLAPLRDTTRRYVECIALDGENHRVPLIASTIFIHPSEAASPAFTLKSEKERVQIEVAVRKPYGNLYVTLDEETLGKFDAEAKTADFDVRQLAPGRHRVQIIAQTEAGEVLPSVEKTFEVASRIKIELPQPKQVYHAERDNPNMALPVRLLRSEECTAEKTRLYIAGELVGEYRPGKLDVSVPLHDVYSGEVLLEAVVVGKDGVESPPESVLIQVKNDAWEERTFNTALYAQIKANQGKINESERDAQEWITRALFAAGNRKDVRSMALSPSKLYTVDEIDSLHFTGQAGESWAKARGLTVQMAQLLSRNGDYYLALRMTPWAKQSYRRASVLAGRGTLTGQIAKARYEKLAKAKLPAP